MKNLIIIDTFGFFFRLYYAMTNLRSKDGKPSGMVSGFANFIYNLERDYGGDFVIFALDSKGKGFRSQIDENYKLNRKEPPSELKEQLIVCIKMLEKMGYYSLSFEGFEADDIIASAVKQFKNKDIFIKIVTSDKDLYQLIDTKVRILSPTTKKLHDKESCFEKLGVYPNQVRDFLAICGDTSDNIPGVKGIGAVGAKKLLNEFKTLEDIFENIDKIRNERTKTILQDSKKVAFLSQKLASLYDDLRLPDLEFATIPQNPLLKVKDILQDYSLKSLLKKIDQFEEPKPTQTDKNLKILNDKTALFNALQKNQTLYFYLQATSKDLQKATLENITFSYDKNSNFQINLNEDLISNLTKNDISQFLNELFTNNFLVIHDLKFTIEILEKNSITFKIKNYFDTAIFYYLFDSNLNLNLENLYKGQSQINSIKVLELYKDAISKNEENLLNFANSVEFPLLQILLKMQKAGIKIDVDKMRENSKKLSFKLNELQNEIFTLTKSSFNLRSPKQLSKVLFEDLKLKTHKKTKTGFSTDESVLNELIDEHESISKILDFRELEKMISTYYEPLINYALKDKNHRVHTTFLQTKTATTRLASINPNLQNIPARSTLSNDLRSCFIAKDGFSLISLDYSQIELRLLAHFSQDETLVNAFLNDEDIHNQTALKIFGEVSKEKRAIAKTINFGILYGMGQVKLAKSLKITNKEAKSYIESYFKAFPTVKNYLQSLEDEIVETGFVTTLFERKRYFDFKNANPMQIAAYKREGVNARFQSSAAEIIKKAMVRIDEFLNEDKKMLLQIHDELIFEVKDEIIQEFGLQVQNIMQSIVKLKIPLKVSLNSAKNLRDLK